MFTKSVRKYEVLIIALVSLFLFAMPRSAAAQADKAENGKKMFDETCSKCHGPDGSGDTPVGKAVGAKDLRGAEAQKMTDAQIATQIEQGKGNMPPFGGTYNKEQVSDLIAYIRVLGKKQAGKKS